MRKLIFIWVALLLIFSYGCSRTHNSDIKEISFSTWGSKSEISTIQNLIEIYEQENPKIKIKLIHIPDNYFQKLHLLIASNLTPDVMFINNLNAKIYIDANKFEPLNEYLLNSEILNKDDFFESAFTPVSVKGSIYAIPRDISNLVIYYNKDLFDKYKIKYPADNWSMQDFLNTAKSLTKDTDNNGTLDIFGFGFEKNSLFWLPFLWSNGGGILSQDNDIILDTKNSKEALQFYADLRNKYHVAPKIYEQSSLTTSQLFLQQKVAMHLCGKWCSLTYNKNADFTWDIVAFPTGKNGSRVGLDVSGWAISSTSKNKAEAWKFIEFMASARALSLITKNGLILPANKKVAYSKEFLNMQPKNSVAFIHAIDNSISTPICRKYSEVNDIINEEFESLFTGKSKADEIINQKLILKLEKVVD